MTNLESKKFFVGAFVLSALLIFISPPRDAGADDFTLVSAVNYAFEHNKALIAKNEDADIYGRKTDDAWSYVMPNLSATAGYTWLSEVPTIKTGGVPDITVTPAGPQITPTFKEIKMGSADNYKVDVRLNQLLFASGQVAGSIKAGRAAEEAAKEGISAQKDSLRQQVTEAFYAVLFAQELYTAKKESLEVSEEHLSDVGNRYKFGAASRYELLRSELEVANLRPEVVKAENNVRIAKTGLKSLMGYALADPISVSGTLDEKKPDLSFQEAMDGALKTRHELSGLDKSAQAQHHAAWAATAGMLPKITAFGDYSYQKPWYFESDWKGVWSVGLGVNVPVFDGLSSWARRGEAAARERQIRRQKAVMTEGIELEIRRAQLDLGEIEVRITQTRDNVERSKEVYRIAETSYKNGAATNLEILDAQLAMTSAKTQNLQALYDYQIAKTKLLAAAGRLGNERTEK
jgi:outer membrane protein